MRNFRRPSPDAADVVADQVKVARRLVGIDDQDLLTDPRTNPATRGRADSLRIQQHLAALDQQHRRALRTGRVRDSRAAAAERTLEAIQSAREATSPGRAVASLSTTRTRYMVGCLLLSIVLSIGSGMAIEAWHQRGDDPTLGFGYIVEAGLTVLATVMIVLRGRLASQGTRLEGWQKVLFWLMIGVPLITSAVLATLGSPIGAICSIGSAAWALAAYLSSTTLSTAIGEALDDVNSTDESELRRLALDGDIEPGSTPIASTDRWISDQTAVTVDQIEAFLADQDGPDTGGMTQGHTGPDHGGPTPRTGGAPREEVLAAWERQQAHNAAQQGGHTVDDQDKWRPTDQSDQHSVTPGVTLAHRARRSTGQANLQRVADHVRAHPEHTVAQVAEALTLSPSTIKRHLRTLRGGHG